MSKQVNLKLPDRMLRTAKRYAESHGYDNLQDLIGETLREKLFEDGKLTYLASEDSLGKYWLAKEEDEAWEHLQKNI